MTELQPPAGAGPARPAAAALTWAGRLLAAAAGAGLAGAAVLALPPPTSATVALGAPAAPAPQAGGRWGRVGAVPGVGPAARLLAVDSAGPDATWAGGEQQVPASASTDRPTGRPLLLRRGADRRWRQVLLPRSVPGRVGSVLAVDRDEVWLAGHDGDGHAWVGRWSAGRWLPGTPPQDVPGPGALRDDELRLVGVPGRRPWLLRHTRQWDLSWLDRPDGRSWQPVTAPLGYHLTTAVRMAADGVVFAALAAGSAPPAVPSQPSAGEPAVGVFEWVRPRAQDDEWRLVTAVGGVRMDRPRDLLVGSGGRLTALGVHLVPIDRSRLPSQALGRPAPAYLPPREEPVLRARDGDRWRDLLPTGPPPGGSLRLAAGGPDGSLLLVGEPAVGPRPSSGWWWFDGGHWWQPPAPAGADLVPAGGPDPAAVIPGTRTLVAVGEVDGPGQFAPWIGELDLGAPDLGAPHRAGS